MRVLWITNMVLPDLASHLGIMPGASGTWMIDISHMLAENEDIDLAVACIHGKSTADHGIINGIRYFTLAGSGKNMLFYTRRFEDEWRRICEDFDPDLVHIHGTEYSHGLAFQRACPDVKTIISVQGLLSRIKDVDYGGLPLSVFLLNRTLKQNLRMNGEIEIHSIHQQNAKYEAEMLQRATAINGVNTWDISLCKSINPNLAVYKIDYNMRMEFYESRKWDYSRIEKCSLFTNPGGTPLKGLHQLIRAISIVRMDYPNVKLYVPGMTTQDGKLTRDTAYAKYLGKLIEKLDLGDSITFVGKQSASQMRDWMLSANAVIVPSAIEGTSLILREAMHLGCPVIASFRGGMADFVSDKVDGFLYDYQEYPYLADRICRLFESRELCELFSSKAIIKAEAAHDRQKNMRDYFDMYTDVSNMNV